MDERSLEGFLGFSDEDLAANRAAALSSAQAARLRASGIWRLVVGPPLLIVSVLFAWIAGNALFAILALLAGALGLYVIWRGFAFTVDGFDGAVAFVTGSVHRRMVRGRYGVTYWASIGPVSKRITPAAYDSLPEGLSCHLYYAPGCRSLLSVEPASAEEPKPDHPFGPDSAHAWDRLRWSWVLITVGALGALVGAHTIATAHAAHAVAVRGTVSNYVETHGRSTTRSLYIDGDSNVYTPMREDSYTPPAPPFGSLVGTEVVLYIDEGSTDVIGLDDGQLLYAADWYLHPEHETVFDAVNGTITGLGSLLAVLAGIGLIVFGGRRAAPVEAADWSAPPLYAPPTVRPALGLWPSLVIIAAVAALVVLGLVLAVRI